MQTVTLISNAGILLALGGATVLIDGLYNARGLPFSDPPEGLPDALNPDYLAFTHTHHDHLDQGKLTAYLADHRPKGLLLPPRVRSDLNGTPAVVMKGASGTVTLPEFTLRWGRTPHLNDARPEHYSFVLRGGGTSVLVAGDARPSRELAALAAGEALAAVVCTPLYLQTPEGRAQLLEQLRPGSVLLYHLPRPEDDQWGLGRMAARQVSRWADVLPVLVLDRPGIPVPLD